MCITGAAAWQMIETEKFSRKKLFIVKSARFNPLIKGLKKVIEEGKLGKIYSFSLQLFWNRPPYLLPRLAWKIISRWRYIVHPIQSLH